MCSDNEYSTLRKHKQHDNVTTVAPVGSLELKGMQKTFLLLILGITGLVFSHPSKCESRSDARSSHLQWSLLVTFKPHSDFDQVFLWVVLLLILNSNLLVNPYYLLLQSKPDGANLSVTVNFFAVMRDLSLSQ